MTKQESLANCIYCDLPYDKLTDEHIIPLGLGGTNILYSSSCLGCNEVTSKVEYFILRGHWLGIRKKLNTGTRRKNRQLDPMKVNLILSDNFKISGTVPVEDCNIQLVFSFYEPEILSREIVGGEKPYARGANCLVIGTNGPTTFTDEKGISYPIIGNTQIEYLLNEFSAIIFFMFLAKVGHSFAIKERGINACKNYFLRDIILGQTKEAMKYIGNASDSIQGHRLSRIDNFHSLAILETEKYLTVLVQLFNIDNHDIQPIYQIVVGELP
jgi:hypothetical protein